MGRSCIDLYAHQIGVPITEVTSFDAYVGGCPTNISVGTRRLGLRSALADGGWRRPGGGFRAGVPQPRGRRDAVHPAQAGTPDERGHHGHPTARPISADVLPRGLRRSRADHRRRRPRAGCRKRHRPRHRHRTEPRTVAVGDVACGTERRLPPAPRCSSTSTTGLTSGAHALPSPPPCSSSCGTPRW